MHQVLDMIDKLKEQGINNEVCLPSLKQELLDYLFTGVYLFFYLLDYRSFRNIFYYTSFILFTDIEIIKLLLILL